MGHWDAHNKHVVEDDLGHTEPESVGVRCSLLAVEGGHEGAATSHADVKDDGKANFGSGSDEVFVFHSNFY